MEIWAIWLIIAGVLLIVEILTQMMWAICLAVGCLAGLVCSLTGVSVIWQIVATAAFSVAAYLFLVPFFQKWHAMSVDKKGKAARTGMEALLGRKATVSEEITPDKPGRARIDGDNWQVTAPGTDTVIKRGTEVVVTGYDSIILEVKPLNNTL